MFRYAKKVRLVSFLQQAFQMALTGFLPVSLWLSLALCDSHSGSHCLPLALTATLWQTLALSSSLLLSNFAYTALDRLTGPLLDSHRRCHDDALPLWWRPTHPRPWSWTPPPPCQCRWTLCQDKQQNQWWQSPWQSWRWPFSPAPWSWHLEGGRGGLDKIKKGHKKVIPTSLCSSSNAVHCSLAVRSFSFAAWKLFPLISNHF